MTKEKKEQKRRGDTMKWEVRRNGRRWTDGFTSKVSAEQYAVLERKKIPADVFKVVGMLG